MKHWPIFWTIFWLVGLALMTGWVALVIGTYGEPA